MNDPSIQGYEEHERAAMVLRSVAPQIGEEAAWFTYSCTQIPDTEYEWIWYWTIPMKNLDWNRNSDIVKLLEDNKKVFTEVSIFLLSEKENIGFQV